MNLADISLKFIKKKMLSHGLVEKLFELDDGTLQVYDNESDNPPLILVNGFGARTEFQWYKVTKKLSRNHRLIVLNLLNFGDSKPKKERQTNLKLQVVILHQLLNKLNIKSAKFFGISYGGLVISEFAYQYENQVDTLTLINAPTKFLDLKSLEKFLIKEGIKSVYDFFIPSDYKGLKEQFRLAYNKRSWLPDFVAKSLYIELCKPYVNGWTEIINDLINNASELQNRDYEFDIPTTLIWGKEDRIIPVEIGTSLNNYFRNSTLHLIDKCGHLPTIEKPKQFLNIVIKNVLQQGV